VGGESLRLLRAPRQNILNPGGERMEKTRPCEICGQPIDPERVEALPATRLCIEHARQMGRYGGEFRVSATWERTSKTGSLKRNYGGVTPKTTRNEQGIAKLRAAYQEEQRQAE
jgi:hypothetical protein